MEGLKRASALGINAMEIEWVQNVPSSVERMEEIRTTAENLDITLTVHAPYFVNLNSPDEAKRSASIQRILKALSMAELAGARSVCVHPAFYMGEDPKKAYENVRRATEKILKQKAKFFPSVNLAYETMGKLTQFGTLEEVLKLSKEFGLYPTLDPAHMHARTNGKINSTKEWNAMLDVYEKYLGRKSLQCMHMHYSGIAYGPKGEKHHLPLEKSDAKWEDFIAALRKRNIGGVVVCESPLLEEDTARMQRAYAR